MDGSGPTKYAIAPSLRGPKRFRACCVGGFERDGANVKGIGRINHSRRLNLRSLDTAGLIGRADGEQSITPRLLSLFNLALQ